MPKVLQIQKGVEEATRELLEALLTTNKVRGVVTLTKRQASGDVGYSLITRAEDLERAEPLYPLMPANAGKILSRLTLAAPLEEPIAAVMKPCELRSFAELVKRAQGSMENVVLISTTCPGVFPLAKSLNGDMSDALPEYWESAKKTAINLETRPACQACRYFIPDAADLIISLLGESDLDKNCRIYVNSEKGAQFAQVLGGSMQERELGGQDIELLKTNRLEARTQQFGQLESDASGITGLVKIFGKCIGCHGCSSVCPICYCDVCFFDSKENESSAFVFENELDKKGATRLPSGTIFFHLGRLSHMSVSCTGCGMCADVCPVGIPVSTVFSKVGDSVQKAFDYTPGRDPEESIPFAVFKEEEFGEVGEQ